MTTTTPGKTARTLVVQVRDAIRASIQDGSFKPGDRLPTEAQMTIQHGVSRTVIREAIVMLKAAGLVDPRRGSGVFVLDPPPEHHRPFANIDHERIPSVLELMELRAPVEIEAAGLAAQRRSPAQEEAMLTALAALEKCIARGEAAVEADFALHVAIAEATNNSRFVEILKAMGRELIPRGSLSTSSGEKSDKDYLEQINREHSNIIAAICEGDVEGARSAMSAHLNGSMQRYRELIRRR